MADNAYITALRLSLSRYQAELLEIRTLLSQRALSNLEYRAAERTLQVSIEACIGVAKHWAKGLAGHSPQDAYQAFEILVQRGAQPAEGLIGWLSQGYSDQLFTFAEQGLVWLSLQEEPKQGDQP